MNLKLLKTLANQKAYLFCVLLALTSCNITLEEKRESDKSISQMSQELCDCFNKQKSGDIDARMAPCTDQVLTTSHTVTLEEGHSRQDSVNAVNTVNDMASKDIQKMPDVMDELVGSCDAFGLEMEALYDRWYPTDSSVSNLNSIKQLAGEFQRTATLDTASRKILHKLITKNIESRRLEEGLRRCKQMKSLYKEEEGAYYASAFIYQLQHKYSLAISELEQEIAIYNKPDLKLIVGVIKRKAQRNKVLVNK